MSIIKLLKHKKFRRLVGVIAIVLLAFAGKFALDAITSFSSAPLRLSTWLGYISSCLAFLYACSVFVQKALGYTVQGWATIMVGVLFVGGVQLICLGIIGEYLSRIFNEIKQRPMYIIEEIYDAQGSKTE